jgi:ubiquinone/menaquinone biosynthesis C-methylase UbiE
VVADFGCGPGYFSLPFAKAIGEDGKLYALDVLPQSLETVAGKAKNAGIRNIITNRVNLEKENGSKIENESLDWIILKDVLFQNQKKDIMIAEVYRVLKLGGKALVVEWNEKKSMIGPQAELRIASNVLKKNFIDQKFSLEKDIEAGDFHYAFVVVK